MHLQQLVCCYPQWLVSSDRDGVLKLKPDEQQDIQVQVLNSHKQY